MPRSIVVLALAATLGVLSSASATAQTRPIQLALFNPVQIFPEQDAIAGIRLNLIYSRNRTVSGLDIGLVNHVTGSPSVGLQWSLVGMVDGDFTGMQTGLVGLTKGKLEGLQWGFYNSGGHVSGVQIGIVNVTDTMYGLQIGLINVIRTGGQFPVFPIVNWSF
jgi:hypothetical protein